MKTKESNSRSANEVQFELKYCERCGGLWLRPMGGGQIYCVACGREMKKLPPKSREPQRARMQQGPRWGAAGGVLEIYEEGGGWDLDATGGLV